MTFAKLANLMLNQDLLVLTTTILIVGTTFLDIIF